MVHVSHGPTCVQASTSVRRQLGLLQQLLTLVPGSRESSGSRTDTEVLLNELCAAENVSQLSHMLTPTLHPWPSHIKYVHGVVLGSSRCFHRGDDEDNSSFLLRRFQTANAAPRRAGRADAADVCSLLQQSCSALEQLQAEVLR